jgi:O-antigen/teichoic acid export membrane protein
VSQANAVFRNTAVLATARIIERLSGLVLAFSISRHLGASGLGAYTTAITYFGLIAVAGSSGAQNLIIREIARDRERTSRYVVHASVLALGLSAVLMGAAWLVIPHLGYSAELRDSLMVIVLAVAPGTLNTIQEAVFIAYQRTHFETVTTLVSSSLLIATSVMLLKTGHGVVPLVVTFVAIEYAVTTVYFVIINRLIVRLRLSFQWRVATEVLHEIKAFAGSSLIAGLFARPEIIVLSLVADTAQVGYYGAALKIADIVQFIPEVYMVNVYPLLSRSFDGAAANARQIRDYATKHLLAFALPVATGIAAAAEPLIRAFYGDSFDQSVVLLRILAVTVPLYALNSVLWRVLAARGEQSKVLRVQLTTIPIRLTAGVALISAFEALGAAIVTPAALAMHGVLLARYVRRDGSSLGLIRLGWKLAVAASIAGGAVFALSGRLPLLALVACGTVVYVGVVILVKPFTHEELLALRRSLPWASRTTRDTG